MRPATARGRVQRAKRERERVESTRHERSSGRLRLSTHESRCIGGGRRVQQHEPAIECRDGMLEGPNLAATGALAARLKTPVIASGGVSSLEDLDRLAALPIAACIVGRALYDGRFQLHEARERAGDH